MKGGAPVVAQSALAETGSGGENTATARDCGLASVMIGGCLIVSVGVGFVLNWHMLIHGRSMMSPLDVRLAAACNAACIALLIWAAVTGLRLSGRAAIGLSGAGRTLNIVALIHLGFLAVNAAAIYHTLW